MPGSRLTALSVLIATAVSGAVPAHAKSGEANVSLCTGFEYQTMEMSPDISFGAGKGAGTVRSNPAGALFDMMTARCLGARRQVSGQPSAWGHCEWTDKDGDKVLVQYTRDDPKAGKMTLLSGTGKFKGIRGTRDYRLIWFPAVPGVGAACDEGTISYTLPD